MLGVSRTFRHLKTLGHSRTFRRRQNPDHVLTWLFYHNHTFNHYSRVFVVFAKYSKLAILLYQMQSLIDCQGQQEKI